MIKQLKFEFDRVIKNRWTWIALFIGICISVVHFIVTVLPLQEYVSNRIYPLSVYAKWLGGENSSIYPTMYYFIVPILCALPYAGTYKEDLDSGYIQNIVTRINRTDYYKAKYIVTLLSGGLIAIIPLILNFLLTMTVLPLLIPQSNLGVFPIFADSMWGDLFYSNPGLYVTLYLGVIFTFMGMLSTITLLATHICDNLFTTILSPFIVYIFLYSMTQLTGLHQICPFAFLRPSQPISASPRVILVENLLLLVVGGVYYYVAKKRDVM